MKGKMKGKKTKELRVKEIKSAHMVHDLLDVSFDLQRGRRERRQRGLIKGAAVRCHVFASNRFPLRLKGMKIVRFAPFAERECVHDGGERGEMERERAAHRPLHSVSRALDPVQKNEREGGKKTKRERSW